jgi:hypothetical protein
MYSFALHTCVGVSNNGYKFLRYTVMSHYIPAEALKADIDTSAQILYELFEKIWEVKEVPAEWKEGHIVKLPKKKEI